jgi:hypothetical protein
MRNRSQRGEFSDVGIALFGLVAGFGMFTVVLLSGLAAVLKAIAGIGC